MKPTPSLGEVYQMVLQDENQRELRSLASLTGDSTTLNAAQHHNVNPTRAAFNPNSNWSPRPNGGRGGSNSHGGGRGSSTSDRRSLYFCDHCKTIGHTVDRYFKIHGYPPQRNDNRSSKTGPFSCNVENSNNNSTDDSTHTITKEQYSQLIALLSKSDVSKSASSSSMMAGKFLCLSANGVKHRWVVDSGATHHITPFSSLMTEMCALTKPDHITMPDGSSSLITHTGKVQLTDEILLHNVLLVPGFAFSLLSVPQLARDMSTYVVFTPSQCLLLQDLSLSKSRVLGEFQRGLYIASPQMKDLGDLRYFLGIEIEGIQEGIHLNQRKYALELLEESGMTESKPAATPFHPRVKPSLDGTRDEVDVLAYRRLVGKLIYLTITRPGA
ncbi:hypothetical protein V2J09_017080 [Rumex salicifolius]